MKTETVEIKSKGQVLGTLEYEYPENLDEAIEADGEDVIFKLYAMKRKSNAMDAKRHEITGGGLPSQIVKALKSADPEVLKAIAAELGMELPGM